MLTDHSRHKFMLNALNKDPTSLTKGSKCDLFGCPQSFQCSFTWYPSGQNIQYTVEPNHYAMDKQLVDGLCSQFYDKWGYIRLAASYGTPF